MTSTAPTSNRQLLRPLARPSSRRSLDGTELASDAALLAAGAALLGAGIALGVSLRHHGPTVLDRRIRCLARAPLSTVDRAVIETVRVLGFPVTYVPLSLALAHRLERRGPQRRGRVDAWPLRVAPVVAWMIHRVLKAAVPRDRPPSQRSERNFRHAYPSGHTTGLGSVASSAALTLWSARRLSGVQAATLATAATLFVGATRVRSDEHWATDVLGGCLAAFGATALIGAFARPSGRARR